VFPLQVLEHFVKNVDAYHQTCHGYLDQAQITAQCTKDASLLPDIMSLSTRRFMYKHRAAEMAKMSAPCATN